jgi:hypothetical protein
MGTTVLRSASTIAFPAVTPPGKNDGDVYVGASQAWTLDDDSLVPDTMGHIFKTVDGGATFTPLHGNGIGQDLPNVPIYVVRYDPGDASGNVLYAGTSVGAYRTVDGGQTWQRFGNGLPFVDVSDMFVSRNSSLVRVATYGRGVWEIYPSSGAEHGVNGNGDFDLNGVLDWADLGAMASRVGTDPTTTVWPTYSWIDDMVTGSPAVSAIRDDDLNAFLAAFGGHP